MCWGLGVGYCRVFGRFGVHGLGVQGSGDLGFQGSAVYHFRGLRFWFSRIKDLWLGGFGVVSVFRALSRGGRRAGANIRISEAPASLDSREPEARPNMLSA